MEFIETCMKLSAYILITDYSDYSQELAMQESSLHKGVWLIKLLWKVKKLKSCKNRIEALIRSTCDLLKIICRSRVNRQVMIFLKLFRNFVSSNSIPDVGSYYEIFARDFEALFRVHSFNIIRQKLPREMRKRLLTLKEQQNNRIEEEKKRDESDSDEQQSSEDQNENEEEQEIRVKRKSEVQTEEDVDDDDDVGPALFSNNIIIPLDMYLIKMIFSQRGNQMIQNKAIDILLDNLTQRKYLMDEVIKVELIISQEDSDLYNQYKDYYNRIKKLMNHIIQDDYKYLVLQNMDKERYKNKIRDAYYVVKNINLSIRHLEYYEGVGYRSNTKITYYDKKDMQKVNKAIKVQNIMRQLGMHKLLLETMKLVYYRHNEHSNLFNSILKLLRSF